MCSEKVLYYNVPSQQYDKSVQSSMWHVKAASAERQLVDHPDGLAQALHVGAWPQMEVPLTRANPTSDI